MTEWLLFNTNHFVSYIMANYYFDKFSRFIKLCCNQIWYTIIYWYIEVLYLSISLYTRYNFFNWEADWVSEMSMCVFFIFHREVGGRHHDVVDRYEISVSQMTTVMFDLS
jgi:hypothetical protein